MEPKENPRRATGGQGEGQEDVNDHTTMYHNGQEAFNADTNLFRGRIKTEVVPAILEVIREFDAQELLPLTLRQLFYQLVSRQVIENNLGEYKSVSNTLGTLRDNGLVSWAAIEDRSRRLIEKRGVTDLESHIAEWAPYLFRGYDRCLVQNQQKYVEVWTEKDALTSIIEKQTWIYCCRIVVLRGQSSRTFVNDYAERAQRAIRNGQNPVIIYVGDMDPTGCRIPYSVKNRLEKKYSIQIELDRVALNLDQIAFFELPSSPDALKPKDPNFKWFRNQGFDKAVEVDALHPRDLQDILKQALEKHLDLEDMLLQQTLQKKERSKLLRLERMFIDNCAQMGIGYRG